MNAEAEVRILDQNEKALLDTFASQITKSKADLIIDIETHLSKLLGMDVKKAFESVAAAQRICGGGMNLNRAHKSTLVLIAHALSHRDDNFKGK